MATFPSEEAQSHRAVRLLSEAIGMTKTALIENEEKYKEIMERKNEIITPNKDRSLEE